MRNFLVVQNLSSTRLVERPDAIRERYQHDAANFSPLSVMQMVDFLLLTQKELKFQFEYQFRFELALLKLIDIVDAAPSSPILPDQQPQKKKYLTSH